VGGAVVQRGDKLFAAARDRQHAEVQPLAHEKTLPLSHQQRQRKDALHRRIGLGVTQRDGLAYGRLAAGEQYQKRGDATHLHYRFGVKSWLGNADASGGLITMNECSVVAWQALQASVSLP